MQIETMPIDCNGKTHKIVRYHLSLTDTLLVNSLNEGAQLAGKVNIKDPSGVPRDLATRVAKCSGGIIAERIFNDFLAKELLKKTRTETRLSGIELFVPQSDRSKGQIDFVLRSRSNNQSILVGETRSSFSYKTASIENVVRYAMSLLGPYVTLVKPSEETKDIHVTVIHRVDPAKLLAESKLEGLNSYIVGGGTKQMFQDFNVRERDNLYQAGAEYLRIKPIWKGLDAYAVVESITTQCLRHFG